MTTPTLEAPRRTLSPTQRIAVLDVLRGIAIIGIIPVNVEAITRWASHLEATPRFDVVPVDYVLNLAFAGRMMPLFALLFGIGFELFLRSAERRTERPRLVMLRRLAFLLVVGIGHTLVYPGEVLFFYAAVGIILLLPASFLPRWLVALAAVVLLVVTATMSGPVKLPALFLAGAAMTRYDVIGHLERKWLLLVGLFAVFLTGSAVAVALQLPQINEGDFSQVGRVAGLLTMFTLVLGVMLLMRLGPVEKALRIVFEPLGRMAFSNYLGTTAALLLFSFIIDAPGLEWQPEYGLYAAAALFPLQWVFSTLWLRSFRFGPLEWVWRTVTWWAPQPMRRSALA